MVFKLGFGLMKDAEARLVIKGDCKPIMSKARSLPCALQDKVEVNSKQWLKAEYSLRLMTAHREHR